jgi:hypothetical protein
MTIASNQRNSCVIALLNMAIRPLLSICWQQRKTRKSNGLASKSLISSKDDKMWALDEKTKVNPKSQF